MKAHAPLRLLPFLLPAAVLAAPVMPKSDHRGLIEIPGVLRSHSGFHWGAANLVAWGPNWQGYAQQDYAMKDLKKRDEGGATHVTGLLQYVGKGVLVDETLRKDKLDGVDALHVVWTLRAPDAGGTLNLARAIVQLPLAVSDFGGGEILSGGKPVAVLPKEYDGAKKSQWFSSGDFTVKGAGATLRIAGSGYDVEVFDSRSEGADKAEKQRFEIRLQFKDTAGDKRAESTVDFRLAASLRGYVIEPGPDWTPLAWTAPESLKPGSILDFSGALGPVEPAGSHGRVVATPDGHFAFEKAPGRRVRFVGANLCYTANFLRDRDGVPRKERAARLARTFRQMGYNAVRFHHTDVTMMKGGWTWSGSAWNGETGEVDPGRLDEIDWLLACMRKEGIYATFDFYAMGSYRVGEQKWAQMKALLPIDEAARAEWYRNVMAWMDHRNPYTGLAWKDDPAIVCVCPINEDAIASVWGGAKDRYNALFDEWEKSAKGVEGWNRDQKFAKFLAETKARANREIAAWFRAHGVPFLLSGCNWWDNRAQAYERDTLDVVDNHGYADHPKGTYNKFPVEFDQKTTLREGNLTYMQPVMKMASRIYGKPFIVTEWNFCPPNLYRAEAGAVMGSYAALQDWDGLWRFAWAHDEAEVDGEHPVSGFNIERDPIAFLSERLVVLLFGRGDASPAQKRYLYAVTPKDAFSGGVGDMWGGKKGLFPHAFNKLGVVSQIGSAVAVDLDGAPRALSGDFAGVVAGPGAPADIGGGPRLAADALGPVAGETDGVLRSDNGQLRLDHKRGTLSVDTPRTAAVVAPAGAALRAGPLSVSRLSTFASVSASALDGKPVAQSGRLLVLFLTDVVNSDQEFSGKDRKWLASWGKLPYLVKTGTAEVSLASETPGLTLWSVAPDGSRLGKVPAEYRDGAYRFTLAIRAGDPAATMVYELGR